MTDRNAERQERWPWLFKLLVPPATCILVLATIELGLAVFHPVPFSIASNMYFESDPFTGFRLRPGGRGSYQMGIPGLANSHGHRDVEVSLKKPEGVFRILALGDSFTVGANVRQEEAYPKLLERRLRREYGPNIEVVNAAVGGWDPIQYAEYFRHYGLQFEPDLVLVGFFVGNDTFSPLTEIGQSYQPVHGRLVSPEAARRRWIRLQVFLYDHSHLARLLLNRGTAAPASYVRKRCDDFTEHYLATQRERMANHLADSAKQRSAAQGPVNQIGRIRDIAGKSLPVVVALLPDENQINPELQKRLLEPEQRSRYDFAMPQSMLAAMFHDIGLPTIDLLPAFLADRRCLYMNDTHWTAQGHELAASAMLDGLMPFLAERLKASR